MTERCGRCRSRPWSGCEPGRGASTHSEPPAAAARAAEFRRLQGPGHSAGLALRHALVAAADSWLAGLMAQAGPGVSLVAVGGYGRGEPARGSDLDLVLLHDGHRDITAVADRIWYPIWDAGVGLDHSVRTISDAMAVADRDLRSALGLLDARHVAGDEALSRQLVSSVRARWRARAAVRLPELRAAVLDRWGRCGEIAFLLEPNLKYGRGGLRDMQALRALSVAAMLDAPSPRVRSAYAVLLDVRGALPVRPGRRDDRLLLQEQDAVAQLLGYADADALVRAVAEAARTVAHAWDVGWHVVAGALASRSLRRRLTWPIRLRMLDEGVALHGSDVVVTLAAGQPVEPDLVLRAAAAAAGQSAPLSPTTLQRLVREAPPMPSPWPASALRAFVALLAAGRPAIPVLEAVDQVGLLQRVLPVWEQVRSRPQRNAFHRFTVDRHLVETAVEAASMTRRVRRPDLLLLAALFHDIGKGWPGDHVANGVEQMAKNGPLLGLPRPDVEVLRTLIREHLTLAEVATRRDLDDPATAARVAEAVGSRDVLDLLTALTEADGLATGPAAWGRWKAGLVADLAARTADVLAGAPRPRPPRLTEDHRRLLAEVGPGEVVVHRAAGSDSAAELVLVVVAHDRPHLLASVAGALALHRLDVRRCVARAGRPAVLIEVVVIPRPGESPDEGRLQADVLSALEGRLSIGSRLADRERHATPRSAAQPPEVLFDVAGDETVLEVRAADRAGVLYRITSALAGLGLDVRLALVGTLGVDVVDTFYVQEPGGRALDATRHADVREAVLDAITT